MMQYVKKGGYIFNFDSKNGYHQLDLFQEHYPYILSFFGVELDICS